MRLPVVAAVASVLSGAPSTVHAVLTGRDVLAAARAAGTLVPGRRDRPSLVTGVVVHLAVSAGWAGVLAAVDRRRKLGVVGGAAAGLVIAALDLGLAARRYPAVRELPQGPQVLDHVAFGAIVGGML
jgi:hypothetical protein